MLFKFPVLAILAISVLAINPFWFLEHQEVTKMNTFLPASPLESAFNNLTDYVVDGKYSLLQLHRKLVEHESISDSELSVSKWLGSWLENAGFTVELQKVPGKFEDRYNVYAYLGQTRDTSIVVTSHIDTVPPYIPYSVSGTQIRGRGTCDAKGSVATQTIAVLDLVSQGKLHEGQVSLLFVVGEENSGSGMREASDYLGVNWDIAIFGEPTENKLGVGHKGILLFDIEVFGQASHSGYPELGISATEILIPILSGLQKLDFPKSDLLGPSTLNIGKIEAGVAANVVPAYAKATVAIRIAANLLEVERLVRSVVDNIDHVEPFNGFGKEPQLLDFQVPGFELIILAYSTDVPNLKLPLKRRFLYGPGTIHVAHGDHEFVDNQDLLHAVDGYKRLIEHSLLL